MDGADSEGQSARPRRRWSAAEKARIVAQSHEPGASIGRVARRNGVADRLLRRWRRLFREDGTLKHQAGLRCPVCDRPLTETARLDAKFCSSKCRQRAYRRRKPIPVWLGLLDWTDIAEALFGLV